MVRFWTTRSHCSSATRKGRHEQKERVAVPPKMQLSYDYIIRKSPFAQRPPARREYIDDAMACRIFGTVGAHQKCLDMSRCTRIREPETFACLLKCKSINICKYVYISFHSFLSSCSLLWSSFIHSFPLTYYYLNNDETKLNQALVCHTLTSHTLIYSTWII